MIGANLSLPPLPLSPTWEFKMEGAEEDLMQVDYHPQAPSSYHVHLPHVATGGHLQYSPRGISWDTYRSPIMTTHTWTSPPPIGPSELHPHRHLIGTPVPPTPSPYPPPPLPTQPPAPPTLSTPPTPQPPCGSPPPGSCLTSLAAPATRWGTWKQGCRDGPALIPAPPPTTTPPSSLLRMGGARIGS